MVDIKRALVGLFRRPAAVSDWTEFWFGREDAIELLRPVRIGIAALCAVYFLSHWGDAAWWFAGDGVLGRETVGRFVIESEVGTAMTARVSPLHWVGSGMLVRVYLVLGAVLALAWPWVSWGRVVGVAVWLMLIGLANRAVLITGLEELLLVWGAGYLAIAPSVGRGHWSGSFALRLIQVHLTLLIAAIGWTMLSRPAWWDGTGVMSLVAPVEDRFVDWVSVLGASTWMQEALTLGIVAGGILGPLLLWVGIARRWGWVIMIGWAVMLGALSSQLIFFGGIAVLLLAFRDRWGLGTVAV
jgi:hypothetical protein